MTRKSGSSGEPQMNADERRLNVSARCVRLCIRVHLRSSAVAFVAAALVSGCAGLLGPRSSELRRFRTLEQTEAGELSTAALPASAALPPGTAQLPSALAAVTPGETDVEVEIVDLPDLSSWPRSLRAEGPTYALFQFSPYVGQFGVLKDYNRADSGVGIGFVGGYRKPLSGAKALAFEVSYGLSFHTNESSEVDAKATRFIGAARLNMRMDQKLTPFAVAGGGIYKLEFDGLDEKFNLSGMGVMFGGGVDYAPKTSFSVRAELGLHIWDAEEEASGGGGSATTLMLGIGAALSF
ncbi:MAG: outer membrane beta-barrel protein [Planctomycetota bacterium]